MYRGLHWPTLKWSCRSSVGRCCGYARVHVVGSRSWLRLNEDTGDTLVKDTVIAGPGEHNQWEEREATKLGSKAAKKGPENEESMGKEREIWGGEKRKGNVEAEDGWREMLEEWFVREQKHTKSNLLDVALKQAVGLFLNFGRCDERGGTI